MKQLVQNNRTGQIHLADIPTPACKQGHLLVRAATSLVSVGTEKYMLELAKKSLLGKALARPDLVKRVINYARTEGVMEAYQQAMTRLDTPMPLGYSASGTVIEVGAGVEEFNVGDRVACAGHPYASHAEVISVPMNLCVHIPDDVSFENAAFVALGGIALQAVRMAQVTLGENAVVIGLGLLGQIAVQLLKASGCHVFGIDIDPAKVALAQDHGADAGVVSWQGDVQAMVRSFTEGHGADAIIILAGTPSNEPLELAAELARERGHIVATGLVGLEIPRKPFYDKELELVVSRAWGPGLYDPQYAEKGVDYPFAYARWTARRNMQEFLSQLAQGRVRVDHLITHRFPIERAPEAYEMTLEGKERCIGILLSYGEGPDLGRKVGLKKTIPHIAKPREVVNVGLIGAGLFATTTLLPVLKRLPRVSLRGVATASGLSGRHAGDKFGFEYCTTDYKELLEDPAIDCVFIATRHGFHAKFVAEALCAGKDAFVEKPLALNEEELREVVTAYQEARYRGNRVGREDRRPLLMVGFNRRFSPFTTKAVEFFQPRSEPLAITCRVNAGYIGQESWVHDPVEGGGRIIGEVCHFVDLAQCLTASLPCQVYANALPGSSDNVVINLAMQDGSLASIIYLANGDKAFPRERVEIFGQSSVCVIENFKEATFTRNGRTRRMRKFNVDRGHRAEFAAFLTAVQAGTEAPVSLEDYVFTTLTTFKILESMSKGEVISIDPTDILAPKEDVMMGDRTA